MYKFDARIKSLERRLEQGQDGALWALRRRDMDEHLAVLRDLLAGRTSFADYLTWADVHPDPDAGRTLTTAEEAQKRVQYEELKAQLMAITQRVRDLAFTEFFSETPTESVPVAP